MAKHLSIGQIVDVLHMWHHRRTWYNPAIRSSNAISTAEVVDQAKSAAQANTTPGLQNPSGAAYYNYTTPPSGSTPGVVAGAVMLDATALQTLAGLNS